MKFGLGASESDRVHSDDTGKKIHPFPFLKLLFEASRDFFFFFWEYYLCVLQARRDGTMPKTWMQSWEMRGVGIFLVASFCSPQQKKNSSKKGENHPGQSRVILPCSWGFPNLGISHLEAPVLLELVSFSFELIYGIWLRCRIPQLN